MRRDSFERESAFGDVRYTPYSLLIESDGRCGRVSVTTKDYEDYFT